MTKLAIALLSSLLVCSIFGIGQAQEKGAEAGFAKESRSPDNEVKETGNVTSKETSREKSFSWEPISIPSAHPGWAFSQRVSNLKMSIIEQKGAGGGKITTLYVASGTYYNATEDDKTHIQTEWTIEFKDAAGTTIDSFRFYLSHDHCSYHGEEPFATSASPSAFNFFDVIVRAVATGVKPAGYQGGC